MWTDRTLGNHVPQPCLQVRILNWPMHLLQRTLHSQQLQAQEKDDDWQW